MIGAMILDGDQMQCVQHAWIFNGDEISRTVWRAVKEIAIEDRIVIIKKDCERIDLRFHQILKKVSAERRFRRCAYGFPCQLDQRARMENVAVGNMYAKIRVDVPQRPGPTAIYVSSLSAVLS